MMNEPNHTSQPPRPTDYWWHRRVMTWLSVLAGLFLFPVLSWLNPELIGLAPMFYTLVCTVVAAYMGTSVFDDKWQKHRAVKPKAH